MGDSWPRNPCNEGIQSIGHGRSPGCTLTMRKKKNARAEVEAGSDPFWFLLNANSPRVLLSPILCHPHMKHTDASNKTCASSPSLRCDGRQECAMRVVLWATGRTSLGLSETNARVRAHCSSLAGRGCG